MSRTEPAFEGPVVYRGGHHVVRCDGAHHWVFPEDGAPWVSGRCAAWLGGCPAKQAEADTLIQELDAAAEVE